MKKILTLLTALALAAALTGCASRRQIDPDQSGSWNIPGTSWMAFCDGPNAFIWVPSRNDTDPDELEAVIYDHPRCAGKGSGVDVNPGTPSTAPSSRPGTDPDGIVDDED